MTTTNRQSSEQNFHEAFLQNVYAEFRGYCIEHRILPSTANLLDYLLNKEVIPQATIRRYVLLLEYRELVRQGQFPSKTQAVKALAEKYGVHENTLWNLLKDHGGKF